MDAVINELLGGLPGVEEMSRAAIRLLFAAILGGIVGIQRESAGKPAGIRTHMIVSMGAALFVISSLQYGMEKSDVSRVVQGIAAGIGFIGGGTILKLTDEREVEGITTAAGIWMTAAVGVSAGLGSWGIAGISAMITLGILSLLGSFVHKIEGANGHR